jgi:hypothetical protein
MKRWLWGGALVLAIVTPFFVDWLVAQSRLPHIVVQSSLDKPSVVADGKSKITITIQVSQDGRPRGNDLVQSWIGEGSGLLRPQWVYTDEQGNARMTFEPNALSPYDNQEQAVIQLANVSVGKLVEVRKEASVTIPLEQPEAQEDKSKSSLGF